MDKILHLLLGIAVIAQQQIVVPVFTAKATAQTQNKTEQKRNTKQNYTLKLNTAKAQPIEIHKKKGNFYNEVVLPIKLKQEADALAQTAREDEARKQAEVDAANKAKNQVQPNAQLVSAPAGDDAFAKLRMCEAGGIYNRNSGNGYYGAYQYDIGTWANYGGYARADLAPAAVQDAKAHETQARRGWNPWPACARKLGLL